MVRERTANCAFRSRLRSGYTASARGEYPRSHGFNSATETFSNVPRSQQRTSFLNCRGRCKLRVVGYNEHGQRIRESLNTRDLARAYKRFSQFEQQSLANRQSRKELNEAIAAFEQLKADKASETKRKYKRILRLLQEYCELRGLQFVPEVTLEALDHYVLERRRNTATWLKEIEILRQFFSFCEKRRWTDVNPAAQIERPRLPERDDVVPYTPTEVANIIAACDGIGRNNYERLRARAMVLLMRFTDIRISDVVTLSREHIQGNYIVKRAIKNRARLRIELQPFVRQALEALPHPKAAPRGFTTLFCKRRC